MHRLFVGCAFSLAAWISFGAALDFSRPGSLAVGRGRFVTGAETQIAFGPDGATVALDPSRTKADEPIYYSLRPLPRPTDDWANSCVELVVRFGDRPAVRKSLSLDFTDAEGEVFRFKPVRLVREGELTRLTYEIRADEVVCPTWGKKRNGRFDGAVHLGELLGSYASDAAGSIVYVSLRGVKAEETSLSELDFDADVDDPLHLLRGRKGPVTLVFHNRSKERRRWQGRVTFDDIFGRSLAQDVDVTAEGGATVRVAAKDVPYKGLWHVTAHLVGDDGRRGTACARFAAVDRHDVTSYLPKPYFRMGINFHAQHYVGNSNNFALVLDALTASGAKLARVGGFKFIDNVPKEGTPDWTRCDAIYAALRARGFALNANLYPGPAWARKPCPEACRKLRHVYNWPTRNGLFRDYCTAFAARYGAGIDYFEIGNEWDLTSAKILPPDEAFRLMDEGYAGVKAACPSGTVITCGWTLGATGPMTAKENPGLLEAFHEKAPYDVWPLHVHGPFASYRTELQTRFFPLRDRVGRGKPWYSNETAMTTAGCNEDEAAQTVWKKILYAWTYGSTDYIWYNLRATSPKRNDSEGGYGLVTTDYRPRATFAAFAALATLVTGSERPEKLEDTPTRFLCRFQLPEGRGTVLAGWDEGREAKSVRVNATRAVVVDLMGNETPLAVDGGTAVWTPGLIPSALVFDVADTNSSYDVCVVGGGPAGIAAALQSGRAGARTLLVERGFQVGGSMTTGGVSWPGLFHAWGRQVIDGCGWELVTNCVALAGGTLPDFSVDPGRRHWTHQVRINIPLFVALAEEKLTAADVEIRYHTAPSSALWKDGGWRLTLDACGERQEIRAKVLIDATGNGTLSALCGAKRLRDPQACQPGSYTYLFNPHAKTSDLDFKALEAAQRQAVADGRLEKTDIFRGMRFLIHESNVVLEDFPNGPDHGTTIANYVDGADNSTAALRTKTNMRGRAAMLRTYRFLRSQPGLEKTTLVQASPEVGVRETWRVVGEGILTGDDYVSGKCFDDAVCHAFYPIDLHTAAGGVKPKHQVRGTFPTIPLRALLVKGPENLLVAGRCISTDRAANSAVRVQATCMATGQVAGELAALAANRNETVRQVPLDCLRKALRQSGAIVP